MQKLKKCSKIGKQPKNIVTRRGGNMAITTETAQSIARMIESRVGIPYQEFEKLDFETQQRLMKEGKKKQNTSQLKELTHETKGDIIYSEPGAFVKKLK